MTNLDPSNVYETPNDRDHREQIEFADALMKGGWETGAHGREGSHRDPFHYVILGGPSDKPQVLVDTLNCGHLITADEQEKYVSLMGAAPELRDALMALRAAVKDHPDFQNRDKFLALGTQVNKALIRAGVSL